MIILIGARDVKDYLDNLVHGPGNHWSDSNGYHDMLVIQVNFCIKKDCRTLAK